MMYVSIVLYLINQLNKKKLQCYQQCRQPITMTASDYHHPLVHSCKAYSLSYVVMTFFLDQDLISPKMIFFLRQLQTFEPFQSQEGRVSLIGTHDLQGKMSPE